jgi:hypothetical protein
MLPIAMLLLYCQRGSPESRRFSSKPQFHDGFDQQDGPFDKCVIVIELISYDL